MKLFFQRCDGLEMRVRTDGLVIRFPQRPRVPHQAKKPAGQLTNAIFLTEMQGLFGKQFSPQANSGCSGLRQSTGFAEAAP